MSRVFHPTLIATALTALTAVTILPAGPALSAVDNKAFCAAQLATTTTVASLDGLSPAEAATAFKKLSGTVHGVTAPAAVSTPWAALTKALDAAANGKPEALYDAALTDSLRSVAVYVADFCGYNKVAVTSTENRYSGLPASLSAGVTAFKHVNKGKDAHVVMIFRRRAGVSRSATATLKDMAAASSKGNDPYPILQKSYEGVSDFSSFAKPGQTSAVTIKLTPGTYLALDSLPVGFTGSGAEPKGPLHFEQGMYAEFTVR